MTTQIQNVTPGGPQGGAPARPPARPGPLLFLVVIAVLVLGVGFGIFKLLHHQNHFEKMADHVTRAVAANNMARVEKLFNALRRPELQDRAKVGALSNFVNQKGAFKGVKEDTPSGSPALYHHFIARFEGGNLSEDMTVDGDGKIADFHIRPPGAQ